jgi:hypothetical protein
VTTTQFPPRLTEGVGTDTGMHGGGPTNTQSVTGGPPVGSTLGNCDVSTVTHT